MSERTWQGPSAPQRQRILSETKTVAIVGASKNPSRASYFVNRYLSSTSNYEIFLVNPTVADIEGTPVYPTLADLPKRPDMVDVFRKYDDLPDVLSEAIAAQAKTIWLQLGLWHEQVARDAEAAGLNVVLDRCLKIEHARFHGGLHLAGFDTGVIDSRRTRG
ncbi:CoA-binding protein [Rhodococcus sp. ARC_M12]|uniref:CoA-binding protein n=1 Tax=unclassified Rhodococcus (in: high G+C Gram-positive bacteria) TaxID=192944 RepID=UPI001FB473DA|nr:MULTISPECIES: CoA-binding protein [unclassified Rhodococcus (in: high G+C Gram-positive bacteria)]MCJ0894004.1 CoA-binding protein [Rhodococcus sp. ARC_M5]MCJ0980192.1 CoA-binding protein [Rhodococcus sp. ARC_M12]